MCVRGRHLCPRPCEKLTGERELPCGRVTIVPCHQRTDNIVCSVTSETVLSCGHRVLTPCGGPPQTCDVRCQELMECGHLCSLPCHPPSQPHKLASLCQEPCSRQICSNPAHSCPRRCSEPCPPCEVRVTRQLACGHEAVLACSEAVTEYECTQRCERPRDCGQGCRLSVSPVVTRLEADVDSLHCVRRLSLCQGHEAVVTPPLSRVTCQPPGHQHRM